MWIEEIFIERFGCSKRLLLENLGPGLNLISGANEAGKTTVLEFIRSIFFGFKKKVGRSTVNTYETPDAAPRGGWLTVRTSRHGRLRVERQEKARTKEGVLTIRDDNDNLLDASCLPILHLGMERNVYEALFAFDLDKMRELDHESLRGKIVAAALGSLQVNPLDVVREVDQRLKSLTSRSDKDQRSVLSVRSRLVELEKRLSVLNEKPLHYEGLRKELEAIDQARACSAQRIGEQESNLERIRGILRYEEDWKRLVSLDRQIDGLEDARTFPTDGLLRLERALEKRTASWENVQDLTAKSANLRRQLDTLKPNLAILENAASIESLARLAQILMSQAPEMDKMQGQTRQAWRNFDDEIPELGEGWDRERIGASDPSVALDQACVGFAQSWLQCRNKIGDFQSSLHGCEEACERLKRKIAHKREAIEDLSGPSQHFLTAERFNLLGKWKDNERKVREMRQKLADHNAMLKKLDEEREELEQTFLRLEDEEKKGRSPSLALMIFLDLLMSGCAGWMVFTAVNSLEPERWIYLSVAAAVVVAAFIFTGQSTSLRKRGLEAIRRQKEAVTEKDARIGDDVKAIGREQSQLIAAICALAGQMKEIAGEVVGNADASGEAILEAERRSLAAEGPYRKKQSLQDALDAELAELDVEQRRKEEIERQLEHVQKEFESLKARWKSFIHQRGLDPNVEPEAARELLRRLASLKKEMRRIAEQEETLTAMRRKWDEFADAVQSLGRQMGEPEAAQACPVDQVLGWSDQLAESKEALAGKKALAERLEEVELQADLEKKKMEHEDQQIEALLEMAGVSSEESFREKAQRHTTYKELEQKRALLVGNLVAGLRCPDEDAGRSLMAAQDWEAERSLEEELQAEVAGLRRESEELANRSGRLSREIEAIEADDESDRILSEMEELTACLNERVREWITLKLAADLLDRTLKIYESEKQPKVMERSSQIFRAITGGAFRAVRFPMDSECIIVEREDRSTVEETLLSRGSLEQVYLSMRLAHLDVYHRDEATIPVVMDDVLVNFDPDRAQRTANLLAKFADETEIQILYFTCHPHTVALFPPDAVRIQLDEESQGERFDQTSTLIC
jgi:uncharacterized protein YhaN